MYSGFYHTQKYNKPDIVYNEQEWGKKEQKCNE